MSFKANKTTEIVKSIARLKELLPSLDSEYLAVDTETTGLNRFAMPVGVSLSPDKDTGYYIPLMIYENGELKNPRSEAATEELKSILTQLLTKSKRLILHNAPFDAKIFSNYLGINIMPYVHCDTVALAHLVYNEAGPLNLKSLAAELLDPEAMSPQDDVRASVLANGGTVTKTNFQMYKCDYQILGRYAIFDTIYTYNLFEKLYPEIDKQGLRDIWENEVLPLCSVTYELNTTGIKVDIPYFQKLKLDIEMNVKKLEYEIYEIIKDVVKPFELEVAKSKVKMTKASVFGKLLVGQGVAELVRRPSSTAKDFVIVKPELVDELIIDFYKKTNETDSIFNLDSSAHKAFLMFDVLKLPVKKETASGKRGTDAKTIQELCEEFQEQAPVLRKILERAKEQKLLTTYVEAILANHEGGRIYSSFNQTATISGRYSCSFPLNLQTLPRSDQRIKQGFIPDDGMVLVAMDYESAEPKIFAHVAGDDKLKEIFSSGLDFYSKIAIDTEGLYQYSADKTAENYLGSKNKELRQSAKAYSLGIPYGLRAGKLSSTLKIGFEEAKKLVDNYLKAYPALHSWMQDSEEQAKTQGYVVSQAGRKRRLPLVHYMHTKLGVTNFSKKSIEKLFNTYKGKLKFLEEYDEFITLYLDCSNELNNAKNFQIQSLAASVTNAAMIKFQREVAKLGINAKLSLTVHDENIVLCAKEHGDECARLLEQCMLFNRVTEKLDVPMGGNALVTDENLAKAK